MVHQDHLDQEKGQNILEIKNIQVEEVFFIQSQHQYMDQFINIILNIYTREVTSFGYHNKLLKNIFFCLIKLFIILR